MKIAVTGKGGVGKDYFCSNAREIVCSRRADRYLQQMWIRMQILAWHWDLMKKHWILSFRFPKCVSLWRNVQEQQSGNQFYHLNPKVDDIPDKYGKVCNGVRLLVLGTVETGGGGCVCPEHVMLKRIINNLVLRREDVVILDMEAGLEHLGRGTTEGS